MADLRGVIISAGKVGANTIANDDGVSGIIIQESNLPTGLEHGVPYTSYSVADVEGMGFSENSDTGAGLNAFRHLSEFYRIAQRQKLYILFVADTNNLDDLYGDVAKQFLHEAKGEIKQLAFAFESSGGEPSLDGIPKKVHDSIPLAQGLANYCLEKDMPIRIFLEGYDYQGNASSTLDLRSLTYPRVTVVIGQDWFTADQRTWKKYADVGTALGVTSVAKVSQNIGDNEAFNLTDKIKKAWLVPGLSSHQKNTEVFSDLQTLEDKGYVFGVEYTGLSGVRWNNDHVATEIIVDAEGNMNEHSLAYGRTMDKAHRLLRRALIPKVKTSWKVDPKTGKLSTGVVKYFEGLGNDVFAAMERRGEITKGAAYIDAESNLLVGKILRIHFVIIPNGGNGEIRGTMNLKTNL